MKRKLFPLLIGLMLVGCNVPAPSPPEHPQASPQFKPTPAINAEPVNPVPGENSGNEHPPEGIVNNCQAGDVNQSPLYEHQVYLTTSKDGLTFTEPAELIIEHASVPDVVIGPDGALWVYFVNGEPGQHGIFAARQTKDQIWEILDCVKIDGVFNGNAVDPNITRLDDGRYRLVYFLGNFVDRDVLNPNDPHPIYSAISEDGINFTVENQLIAVDEVTDPSLLQLPDGSWLLAMTRPSGSLLAASLDGQHFELLDVVFEEPGIPELALLSDGRIALYLGQVHISNDGGQTWTADRSVQVPGGGADPSMTSLPDGSYIFVYKGFSSFQSPPPEAGE